MALTASVLRAVPARVRAGSVGLLTTALILTGCGGGDTVETSAPPEGDRTAMVAQFPPEIQPELDALPTELVRQLLQVRLEGPKSLVWTDAGGEMHDGFRRAFIQQWEKLTGWKVEGCGCERGQCPGAVAGTGRLRKTRMGCVCDPG